MVVTHSNAHNFTAQNLKKPHNKHCEFIEDFHRFNHSQPRLLVIISALPLTSMVALLLCPPLLAVCKSISRSTYLPGGPKHGGGRGRGSKTQHSTYITGTPYTHRDSPPGFIPNITMRHLHAPHAPLLAGAVRSEPKVAD